MAPPAPSIVAADRERLRVVLILIHAYAEQHYRLTVPQDAEVGVTTSDDLGIW